MASGAPKLSVRPAMQGSPEPIAALNRVRILESGVAWPEREPLVDIRRQCPDVPLSPGTCPFLREQVAAMLNVAQASLPSGFRVRVATALRTLSMQKSGWDRYFARMQEEHPTWPRSALRRATNRYHAPYDQKAPPGHCTGGAVDVVLIDSEDKPLDVTSPTQGWEAAYTWSDKLSAEARANRMIMVEAMLRAGFSNCREEYWHYSWGDSAWAVRVGEYECPYDWSYPPVCIEPEAESGSLVEVDVETTRNTAGRPLGASGAVRVSPAPTSEVSSWQFRLNWARDVPVALRVKVSGRLPEPVVYAGPAPDDLQLLNNVRREGDELLITLISGHDQLLVSGAPSPPKPVEEQPPGEAAGT